MWTLCFLTNLFLLGTASDIFLQKTRASIEKISCDFNPSYIDNSTCILKPIKRNVKLLKFGANVMNPFSDASFRFRQMKKTSANRYMPGLFDITRDYCAMMDDLDQLRFFFNLVDNFQKGVVDQLKKLMRKCPFQGSFLFEENSEACSSLTLERGDFMNELLFFNSKNETIFQFRTFVKLSKG